MTTYVHRDIDHFTGNDSDQFALRLLDLVMQAAQNTAPGFAVVILHEARATDHFLERAGVVTLVEEAAIVAEHFGFEEFHIGQRRIDHQH